MRPHLPQDIPTIAPEDSTRVLVCATGETMTVGAFVLRYQVLNPFDRKPPRTPGEMKARGEQFLGASYFQRESRAQGLENTPDARAALAERRESVALDHYYGHHVAARVDLHAVYDRDPTRYDVPAHLHLKWIGISFRAPASLPPSGPPPRGFLPRCRPAGARPSALRTPSVLRP